MAIAETPDGRTILERVSSYVEWAPIIAGSMAAAAISLVLLTFGSAIGLTAISPWPNSGLPTWLVAIIAALWLLIVQAGSYALGGYLAGRLRAPVTGSASAERNFRDGAHGFLVWALGAVLTTLVLGITAGAALQTGANVVGTVASGAAQGAAAATRALASGKDPVAYAIDRMVRPGSSAAPNSPPAAPGPTSAPAAPGAASASSPVLAEETGRIFASAIGSGALPADDRAYLANRVATLTGIPPAEAEKRVDDAFGALKQAEVQAREAADQARRAAAIAGFIAAAAMLIAAAAAAAGAGLGGAHRDENSYLRLFGRERLW